MSLCLLAACSEADDIRDRIDRQNERLAALENLVEQVNGNVLAISARISGRRRIPAVWSSVMCWN